jgi:hypothetical protein
LSVVHEQLLLKSFMSPNERYVAVGRHSADGETASHSYTRQTSIISHCLSNNVSVSEPVIESEVRAGRTGFDSQQSNGIN